MTRQFLLISALVALLVAALAVVIAGPRGGLSRRPPLEFFADMNRQPKLLPQKPDEFFADGRASRLPVPGTIARSSPYQNWPVNTGRVYGLTNFAETGPLPLTAERLAQGRQHFEINCAPCHGSQGDGNGITKKFGMNVVANLHDPRIVALPDGEIFNTIGYGKGLMGGYLAELAPADRWAIVAYLRALQRSRLGTLDEVPPESQATLKK